MTPELRSIKIFPDDRGWFMEGWNAINESNEWVQDNFSWSVAGVLRGLHCQIGNKAQRKRVAVLKGRIWDVIVNPETKKWETYELTPGKFLKVPRHYLHGFLALEDSMVWYKVDAPYDKESERTVLWNDPDLNIPWPSKAYFNNNIIISEKDALGISIKELYGL